jgi:hypothetical protein
MKQTISLIAIISLLVVGSYALVVGSYMLFEPEITNAASTSTVVTLTVNEEITITPPAAITMSPNISMTQNTSIGGTSTSPWVVKTNSQAGYILQLQATTTPALKDVTTSETFSDATTTSPKAWGFSAGQSCAGNTVCFGFSVFGNNVGGWGTGADCGSGGTPSATLLYRGFIGTTDILVASSTSETGTSGTNTTLCVAAAQNGVYAPNGTYTTTITGTATVQ